MKNNKGLTLLDLLIIITIILVLFGPYIFGYYRCEQQCQSFTHKWGILSGCMIQGKDGKWIPLENYRNFE